MFEDPKIQWFKRVVFGRATPNKLLKWTCLLLFLWSACLLFLMCGLGLFAWLSPEDSVRFEEYTNFREQGIWFFFPYAGWHLISLIAIALIYRLKKTGLIMYTIASAGCTLHPWFMGSDFPTTSLIFSLICVVLFLVHIGSMHSKQEQSVVIGNEVSAPKEEQL
jgi:hypothetical protein